MSVTYTIEIEPEEYYLAKDERDNMISLADGDYDLEKAAFTWFDEVCTRVNTWQWCVVKITARYYDHKTGIELVGTDMLGCCSYKDEDQFKADGYYVDMCNQALAELIKEAHNVIDMGKKLQILFGI